MTDDALVITERHDNGVALVLSILVTAYLVYALIAPEKL
jgi:K+-transporting ATPase KdpF subunit